MAKCRDCRFVGWNPVCQKRNILNRDPVGDESLEWDCVGFQPGPPLLVDELAEALDAILDAMIGSWFSYTKLPGKIEDAEAEAQKLVNRAYAVLARHQKEVGDA